MKNRDVNRKVLKAISIGLSAALSLMPTVTVFADDDVDNDNGPDEQVEESGQEESGEENCNSDVSDACDEASKAVEEAEEAVASYDESGDTAETVSEASEETTDPAAAASQEISEAISEAEDDVLDGIASDLVEARENVESLGADIAELDVINNEIAESNSDYAIAEQAAEYQVSYAKTKTDEAAEAVKETEKKVEDSHSSATVQQESVSEASEVLYADEESAESAKADAVSEMESVQSAIEEGQAAVDNAQKKLEGAAETLEHAESAVKSAAKEKAEADAKEAEAREKLQAILDDSNVKYEKDENDNVVISDDDNLDSKTRKAIEAAQRALDKAQEKADAASSAYDDALNKELAAAQEKADAANKLAEEAESALKTVEEAAKSYEATDKWVEKIQEQQNVVKNAEKANTSAASKVKEGTRFHESYVLATYLEAYKLSQNKGVDAASITVERDDTNYGGKNLYYVKYKAAGSDTYERMYIDVKCDINKPGNVKVCEHPVTNPKPLGFGEDQTVGGLSKSDVLSASETATESYKALINEINAELQSDNSDLSRQSDGTKLTVLAAKKYLADTYGYDVDDISVPDWGKAGSTVQSTGEKYIPVEYTSGNETKRFYFYYNEGEDGSGIELCLKTATELGAEKYSDIYEIPGSQFDEGSYEGSKSAYQASKQEAQTVLNSALKQYEQAKSDSDAANGELDAAKEKAETLDAAVKKAESLKNTVKNARDKVLEAADALKEAQTRQAVSAEKLAELEAQLADAKTEYNEASEALKGAEKKLSDIRSLADRMSEDIENGFKYKTENKAAADEEKTAEESTEDDETAGEESKDKKEETAGEESEDREEDTAGEESEDKKEETAEESEDGEEENAEEESEDGEEETSQDESDDANGSDEDEEDNESGGGETPDNRYGAIASVDEFLEPGTGDKTKYEAINETIAASVGDDIAVLPGSRAADIFENPDNAAPKADVISDSADVQDEDVLGQRMAPIVEAAENGTFTRSMMFTEDGLKIDFVWWLIIVVLGAKGVQMYVKNRKKACEKGENT